MKNEHITVFPALLGYFRRKLRPFIQFSGGATRAGTSHCQYVIWYDGMQLSINLTQLGKRIMIDPTHRTILQGAPALLASIPTEGAQRSW